MRLEEIQASFNINDFILNIKKYLKYVRNYNIKINNLNSLIFISRNYVTKFRYETFFFKEPETLAWIDKMEEGSVYWDIGANIGLYTIYFLAKNKKGKAVAFEPHPSNLLGLIENLKSNKMLNEKITIIPNPVYSENSLLEFSVNSIEIGDSNHTVSKVAGNDSFRVPTTTIDQLVDDNIAIPNYIKIDVDGNEIQIIKAASSILKNKELRSILIEIDINNDEEREFIVGTLKINGFSRYERFDSMTKFGKKSKKHLFNYIFYK